MKTKSILLILNHAATCLTTAMLLLPGMASAQSSLSFGQSSWTCSESDGTVVLRVVRSGAADTLASVSYSTVDGTACSGVRYTATSGTLQFAAGQTNLEVTIPILNDGFAQGSQFFRVLLSQPSSGAVLGANEDLTVVITDNDLGIQFINPSYAVSEGAGLAQVTIIRTEDGARPVTVELFSTDLSAKAGVDYVGVTNQITFAPEEIVKVITVPILNNDRTESTRAFKLTLANVTGTSLGPQANTTVNILDNDQGFSFVTAGVSVSEDVGAVPIVVLRGTDDTNSAATVDFFTLDQTATNGFDYVGVTNTLAFAPGEMRKTVAVPILNNGTKEPNRTFRVRLAKSSGGAILGSPTALTVTIVDNDPQLGFERTSYTSPWGASEIALPVLRGNDAKLDRVTVDYTTSDISARAGTDYQADSGTLEFAANETVKSLRIRILANRPGGAFKAFRVSLRNPSNGAALGTAVTSVRLEGKFFTVGPRFAPQLTLHRDGGFNLLSWLGNGQLQRADRPDGPWSSVGNVQSPLPISSALPGSFYRIKNPRPVNVYVPAAYDGRTPIPLVIALHGYTSSGSGIDSYFNLTPFADSRRFLYCFPDGLTLRSGGQDWNCWFDDPSVASAYSIPYSDDVGFIRGIIQSVAEQFNLDHKRVYLVGHSQGGGMSHFAALRCADLIAAIASLAGDPATFYPTPTEPVNVLHIHGTADETVSYTDTLPTAAPYTPLWPGALHLGQIWAAFNGATGRVTDSVPTLDLDTSLPGLDTVITRWKNAPPGGAVEVWSIIGGHHVPSLSASFTPTVLDWLLAHPKP
jgi:polyhydroxybutyrate depolymerase